MAVAKLLAAALAVSSITTCGADPMEAAPFLVSAQADTLRVSAFDALSYRYIDAIPKPAVANPLKSGRFQREMAYEVHFRNISQKLSTAPGWPAFSALTTNQRRTRGRHSRPSRTRRSSSPT